MAEAEETLEQPLVVEEQGPARPQPKPRRRRHLIEIITSQLAALRIHHREVLATEGVEAVHKMRVTTRRLQASMDLLEREMKLRKSKNKLRKWRRALSEVRNYDVFLDLIEKETVSRGRARRAQLQLVKAILQERRSRKATKVRQFLDGIDIDKIARRLGLTPAANVVAVASVDGVEVSTVTPVTPTVVIDEPRVAGYAAERLDQRLAEFQSLVARSHPTNDPAELHQLRIAAKRVRYLLEIVSEIGYGDASRALAWLRTLQDRIGDWHDLEALEEEIISIVSNREFMKQNLAESSQMLQAAAHLQKKKQDLKARLFPVRMPRHLVITSQRISRALRRSAVNRQPPNPQRP